MIRSYIAENRARFMEEWASLIRIPSISCQPAHKDDMLRCAERWRELLLEAGAQHAEVMPSKGNPFVYAEYSPMEVEGARLNDFLTPTIFEQKPNAKSETELPKAIKESLRYLSDSEAVSIRLYSLHVVVFAGCFSGFISTSATSLGYIFAFLSKKSVIGIF